MGSRVLVVQLAPAQICARLIRELRQRYPEAALSLLSSHDDPLGADEVIPVRATGRSTRTTIKSLHPEILVVAHGADLYWRRSYWRAIALAVLSGARNIWFCPEGILPGRGLLRAMATGVGIAALRAVQAVFAALLATVALALLFAGVVLTDTVGAVLRGGRTRRPRQLR